MNIVEKVTGLKAMHLLFSRLEQFTKLAKQFTTQHNVITVCWYECYENNIFSTQNINMNRLES